MGEAATPTEAHGRHDACEICRTIPERVSSTSRGDESRGGPIPPAVGRLEIVGAPLFDGDTSRSNAALHKCPLCGTFYWWEHEYEYLAGGSEDSDTYTRLEPEAGARRERECLAQAAAARDRARERAEAAATALLASTDERTVADAYRSVSEALEWQLPVDLSAAAPALAAALARLGGDATPGLRYYLPGLLRAWVGDSPGRAREVVRLIGSTGVAVPSDEARALVERCEEILAGAKTP